MNATTSIEEQLAAIQGQLAEISEDMATIRRTRDELQDLKEDLSHVIKDVFQSTVVELEEVSPFLQKGEWTDLWKRGLRNMGNFNELLIQMESMRDFVQDATPIGKEVFKDILKLLHELEQKGYFAYARELGRMTDNIASHFSVEDVRLLADNIVTILETVKSVTQPEMLQATNNALSVLKSFDPAKAEPYSIFRVIREINSPEMRRAWGVFYSFLMEISNQADAPKS